MIQIILVIYLCVSISKIAKEKAVSATPYILSTIGLTLLPSLVVILLTGEIDTAASIFAAIIGIALAFIPRFNLRGK